jgi:hypothetical protein
MWIVVLESAVQDMHAMPHRTARSFFLPDSVDPAHPCGEYISVQPLYAPQTARTIGVLLIAM